MRSGDRAPRTGALRRSGRGARSALEGLDLIELFTAVGRLLALPLRGLARLLDLF